MSKRSRSEMNGNGNGNGKGPLNGKSSHNGNGHGNGHGHGSDYDDKRRYRPHPEQNRQLLPRFVTPSSRRSTALLPLAIVCLSVALALGLANLEQSRFPMVQLQNAQQEPFRLAVNRAMSAAQLTQSASSREEWQTVANWWQEAIDLMQQVPPTNSNYPIAQDKVDEYQQNLDYAKTKVQSEPSALPSDAIWGLGSRRAEIIRIQGNPTDTVRYDSLCQEVLSYGKSAVELNNGIAVRYDDVDKNLKVAAKDAPAPPPRSIDSWTIGTTREAVFSIQGTPARIVRYDASAKELLYYGSSTIELTEGRVTSYNNLDNNLRVAIVPTPGSDTGKNYWTVGSERNEVFRTQGTPNQVSLDNSLCREVLHYSDSTVELRNSYVSGYDNFSNNLRVQVK